MGTTNNLANARPLEVQEAAVELLCLLTPIITLIWVALLISLPARLKPSRLWDLGAALLIAHCAMSPIYRSCKLSSQAFDNVLLGNFEQQCKNAPVVAPILACVKLGLCIFAFTVVKVGAAIFLCWHCLTFCFRLFVTWRSGRPYPYASLRRQVVALWYGPFVLNPYINIDHLSLHTFYRFIRYGDEIASVSQDTRPATGVSDEKEEAAREKILSGEEPIKLDY